MYRKEQQMTHLDTATKPRILVIGLWICVSWFILALVSSGIAYYVTTARGTFEPVVAGLEYILITHVLRLVGGLLIVLWLIPLLLGYRRENYGDYLRLCGIPLPSSRRERITFTVFAVVVSLLMVREFVVFDLITDLETYHNSPLWLLTFTAFQPAIVEELLSRGAAFGVLRKRYPVWVAVIVPAIFFGLMHIFFGPQHTLIAGVAGMAFALLRWRTGTVWGCVAMHFFINWGTGIPVWGGWLVAMGVDLLLSLIDRRSEGQTTTQSMASNAGQS
jgi:membrane protease YdiL (CAAX protease family)